MASAPKTDGAREAWITGIGIVSCLGEGPEQHWQGLNSSHRNVDVSTFAPYIVHPLVPIDFDKQIPKKGDQRQMEAWQRIGVYAAGLALDSAGVKGNAELLGRTDMIVAAAGGERDYAADSAILSAYGKAEKPDAFLNERLMNDLRPTLFLAQLSNLLAGNISIVQGVTGSSRTFMGEEPAGVNAMRIALARINAGQSDIMLVGGSYNGERPDVLLLIEFGGYNLKGRFAPVWQRGPDGGLAIGSLGAFVVVESRDSAEKRGAKCLARLAAVLSDRSHRKPGDIEATLAKMWDRLAPEAAGTALISGTPGTEPATSEERTFLARHPELAVRATGSYLGHGAEPQFVMNIALAVVALGRGTLFPPGDDSGVERPMQGPLKRLIVTGVGHWRGEAMALVEAP
jgi:3-oxoacyl-[acyl-carrier-protein] synthase II